MPCKEELDELQRLPLDKKISISKTKIVEWYEHWKGKVYVSFSGGKDSTVLLHLVRSIYPDVVGVFIDTGLEFPEIREFVKKTDNIIWIRPKKNFKEVIEKYGYPVVSKEQAERIYYYRTTKSEKSKNSIIVGRGKSRNGSISKKWFFLTEAPFKISHYCCYHLKKSPAVTYNNKTKQRPYLGNMVEESRLRRFTYMRNGCNNYATKEYKSSSTPLSFWTSDDIKKYIEINNLPYSKIYDMGYDRTGCMFCMFGLQYDKCPNRFQKMKLTHPKIYDYCIDKLGIGEVLDFMKIDYK